MVKYNMVVSFIIGISSGGQFVSILTILILIVIVSLSQYYNTNTNTNTDAKKAIC